MNFPRFAYNNVKRNARAYFAYFLSSAFMVMIFFSFAVFIYHPANDREGMHRMAKASMSTAEYIIFVFAFFFVLYSISVFLKSRNKEFGLLLMLGAKPSQLNRLVFLENILIGAGAILSGLAGGLLLSKLFLLAAAKMTGTGELPFYWPVEAALLTFGAFSILFLAISVLTLLFVRKRNVLELIQGSAKPKTEPKVSIWLALLGVALLVVGYLALHTEKQDFNPSSIFVAAAAGIAGTYFFYSQLSVLFMRLLKRRRAFVWKRINLLWISEMAYKIKDNARVLFLVTVVTSIAAMSTGFVVFNWQQAKSAYASDPYAMKLNYYGDTASKEAHMQKIAEKLDASGIDYQAQEIAFTDTRSTVDTEGPYIEVVAASDYRRVSADWKTPAYQAKTPRAALLLLPDGFVWKNAPVVGGGMPAESLNEPLEIENTAGGASFSKVSSTPMLVVSDETYGGIASVRGDGRPSITRVYYRVPDWDSKPYDPESREVRLSMELQRSIREMQAADGTSGYMNSRAGSYEEGRQYMAVFSFIGIFIALMFSLTSASFLYFKLHAELSRDAQMYRSLSKTGLSIGEMRKSATLQIALLFFIPILVSAVQTFVVLDPILALISVQDISVPILLTMGAFLAVQAVYFLIVQTRYIGRLKKVMV
ncbi:ABC transporter permease [Saccharibacillus sp. CPCC 101409]|uniref:ABC transporter permease n=1 Tax=Saccharibacillus sp. CPCC 101409 TaxID=3058041 RepID=UPI0026710C71|nr:ABC transporter permease [Saccharibacillus sp. CPCC 101409]MDO3411148.1 ABC transporter permease [Saccharibacillus sp. CPCC 101409]